MSGIPVTLDRVVALLPSGPRGHSLLELAQALESLGCTVDGIAEPLDAFAEEPRTPAIVRLRDPDHFMLVASVTDQRVAGYDAHGERASGDIEQLRGRWTGQMLVVRKARTDDVQRDGPSIDFDTLLLDKGDVPATGKPVEFTFRFVNKGGAALAIEKVSPGCGCMESHAPEQPIAPGDSGTITVVYHGDASSGSFHHEILVKTNDPHNSTLTLRAGGFRDAGIAVRPARLNLGRVAQGQSRVIACFVAAQRAGRRFAVKDVRCTIEGTKVEWYAVSDKRRSGKWWPEAEGEFSVAGPAYAVEVTFTARAGVSGPIAGSLTVDTDANGFEELSVPILAEVSRPAGRDRRRTAARSGDAPEQSNSQASSLERTGRPG
jgi:hypothetical protein